MSQRERDWLHWLKQASQQQITQRQAAEQMQVSERWVRELLRRMKAEGDRVVVHGLRDRPSNRKIPDQVRERSVALIRRHYQGFRPTLAAEYLAAKHDIRLSKETVRQIMIEAGLWRPKPATVQEIHQWRRRRSCCGEMTQWDSSDHDWLEGRGPRLQLIAMVDDATSRGLARFTEHDTTAHNMEVLERYLRKWGRMYSVYTDKASLFHTTPKRSLDGETPEPPPTQIGRALNELGSVALTAHSPQAKGRIERFFGTAQDRLVKGLRVAGIRTLAAANDYLEDIYLPLWNERFTVAAAHPADLHRPLEATHDLAAILSYVDTRQITNDYTIRWHGKIYQIARGDIRPRMRRQSVRVELRRDGALAVRFENRYLRVSECETPPARKPSPRSHPSAKPVGQRPRSPWMDGFDLQRSRPLWAIVQEEQTGREEGFTG